MGSALAKAAVKSGGSVYVYDKNEQKANELSKEIGASFKSGNEIAEICDFIYLAVKPNVIASAISEITEGLKKNENACLVSMAAGVSIAKISEAAKGFPIIRIMPNTPAAVGEGLILWTKSSAVTKDMEEGFLSSISMAGKFSEIAEEKIDAASAISGCGPAFVYMFIEALADGGVECGLARDLAQSFAAQTVLGAAKTLLETGKHPGELKDAVCSPGGSTIAGVAALEEGAFRATAAAAVKSAYEKTLLLGK